jgi:hypothetical protein
VCRAKTLRVRLAIADALAPRESPRLDRAEQVILLERELARPRVGPARRGGRRREARLGPPELRLPGVNAAAATAAPVGGGRQLRRRRRRSVAEARAGRARVVAARPRRRAVARCARVEAEAARKAVLVRNRTGGAQGRLRHDGRLGARVAEPEAGGAAPAAAPHDRVAREGPLGPRRRAAAHAGQRGARHDRAVRERREQRRRRRRQEQQR